MGFNEAMAFEATSAECYYKRSGFHSRIIGKARTSCTAPADSKETAWFGFGWDAADEMLYLEELLMDYHAASGALTGES